MARGRKPTPTRLLVMRGSKHAKTRQRQGEVTPPPAECAAPEWLSERAKAHWQETAPRLAACGLLTALDTMSWAMACVTWAQAMALHDLIVRDGMVLPTEDGGSKLHPALRVEDKLFAAYLKVAEQFGCTPRARVGLTITPVEVDELDEFIARGKKRDAKNDKERFFRRGD